MITLYIVLVRFTVRSFLDAAYQFGDVALSQLSSAVAGLRATLILFV